MLKDGLKLGNAKVETKVYTQENKLCFITDNGIFVEEINGLKILKELSRGASGVVFLARADDGNLFAVKVWTRLRSKDDRDKQRQGLKELVKTTRYPSSIQVFDADMQHGFLWAVMEYVNGHNLRDWLKTSEATYARRVYLALKLIEFETEARDKQIYHGDLHAKNIMVVKEVEPTKPIPFDVKIIDPGTSVYSASTDYRNRHFAVFQETLLEILDPLNIGEIWRERQPLGVTISGGKRISVQVDLSRTQEEEIVSWNRDFLIELPKMLGYLGFYEPSPVFAAMFSVSDPYPYLSSSAKEALDKLRVVFSSFTTVHF